MESEKTIDALNSLIVINNDRIEGYKTAEAEAKETDLKMLFSDFMETSVQNRKELVAEVTRLDGTPDEGTRITGKFFRVWMDVKAAFTGDDRKTILESCKYGEEVALDAYKKVLIQNHQDTDSEQQEMLNKHYAMLKVDHDRVAEFITAIEAGKRIAE
ncbi:MAG: hypothetical protein RLZZ312_1094 [Bacteroidota bacterium]|jgi:uncharacterized protein (TIGR02284 family)